MTALVPLSGTVYTPKSLARAMVSALGVQAGERWLDPCVGDGAFIRELTELGAQKDQLTAIDIVSQPTPCDSLATTLRGVDFVEWAARSLERFDKIVLNPPYVALSRVHGAARRAALALQLGDGTTLSLKANYWCAFLLACLHVLLPDGDLCAVLPAAWDFADYAHKVKSVLANSFAEFVVVRSRVPLFGDVLDGSVVVIARGFLRAGRRTMHRIEAADADAVFSALASSHVPSQTQTVVRVAPRACDLPTAPLRDLVDIRIGAVTGDAQYFLLNEKQRRRLGLPVATCRKVVSRAKHLCAPVVTEEVWDALRERGERVWLFHPPARLLRHPAVESYLGLAEEAGGCKRRSYKVSRRDVWYKTPLPRKIDGFLSGMSKRGPFLVLNGARLTATNTLYVVRFRHRTSLDEKSALGLALLSTQARESLHRRARMYADGLLKFEPADLGSIEVPVPPNTWQCAQLFERATMLLLAGRERDAQELADAWVAGASGGKCLLGFPTPRVRRFEATSGVTAHAK